MKVNQRKEYFVENYLKNIVKKFANIPIGIQALGWFISFKVSEFILSQTQNVGIDFFNIILQFILSLFIMLILIIIIDRAIKSRNI